MGKKKTEHTTFRNGAFFCLHCGQSHQYVIPIPIKEMIKQIDAFNNLHRNCKPVWKQPEADLSMPIEERMKWWTENGEFGTSNQTIFSVLSIGKTKDIKFDYDKLIKCLIPPTEYDAPHDPDDFRRCLLLLKNIPEWKSRLDELKTISPVWAKYVENWDKLTAMFEHNDENMYKFMISLREEIKS